MVRLSRLIFRHFDNESWQGVQCTSVKKRFDSEHLRQTQSPEGGNVNTLKKV